MRQGQQVMPGPATVTPPYGVTSKVTEDGLWWGVEPICQVLREHGV